MEKIKVSVQTPTESIGSVRVDGVVDTLTSGEVDDAISALISRNQSRIILDLAGVDYISSAGWGIFISHLKETRRQGGDIRLCGMVPNVREIFELLEFDTVLHSYPTYDHARQSFENGTPPPEGGPRSSHSASDGLSELSSIGVDAPTGTRSTVTGARSFASSVTRRAREDAKEETGQIGSPLEALLKLIREDPFYSISELKRELNSSGLPRPVTTGWLIRTLWSQGLFRRSSRFRYARRMFRSQVR